MIHRNRAKYSWDIDNDFLKITDENEGKSLTNDIENCLTEIFENLTDKVLTDYKILYCDSEGCWDAIEILNDLTVHEDMHYLKIENSRGRNYQSRLKVSFVYIGESDYEKAKIKLQNLIQKGLYNHYQ